MSDAPSRLSGLTAQQRAVLELRLRAKQAETGKRERIGRRTSDGVELSFGQQRLWFMEQVGNAANHLVLTIRLRGPLLVAPLYRAITAIADRHEVLRTQYGNLDGRPVVSVSPPGDVPCEMTRAEGDTRETRLQDARRQAMEEAARPFDLRNDLLFRVRLIQLEPHDHVVVMVIHHLVADGWSIGVLSSELAALYNAFSSGLPSPLPPLAIQYADFAAWQREYLSGDRLAEQSAWWRDQLSGLVPLEVPTDWPRPPEPSMVGARAVRTLDHELLRSLNSLAQRQGVTLFGVLLAAFDVMLMRWSGQTDFAVGTPTAGRNWPEVEPLIGLFVNHLVLRAGLSGNPRFSDVIGRVRSTVAGALAHQDVPFERLVDELGVERSYSQAPLTPVIFSLQNVPVTPPEMAGLIVEPFEVERQTARFDLSLFATETPSGLHLALEYRTDLFEAESAAQILRRFEHLLQAVVANPDRRLAELPLLSPEERHQVLSAWNATAEPYAREPLVQDVIADHARRAPQAIALVSHGQRITYAELDERAGRVAGYLARQGVGPETVVGVCADRGIPFVVAAVGVLKAGGAYAPIDPRTPPSRRGDMLRQDEARLLLVDVAAHGDVNGWSGDVVTISDAERRGLAPDATTVGTSAQHLAYVIHTSGSTGVPKAVAITHGSLLNLVSWHHRTYGLTAADATTQVASVGFDACVWEMWPSLCAGATLHIPDDETKDVAERLWAYVSAQGISSMFLPTPQAELALQTSIPATRLRSLLTGGDRLHRVPVDAPAFAFVNHYGPTETTVVATAGIVETSAGRTPPIGRPIDNTQVYVLDPGGEPVPVGATGELYIGGDGLARGYLGAFRLTAERFVPDPFSGRPGARLYRTGDLVRYLRSGTLEFIGRRDHQVKVRGYRIELGEIETALQRHPAVQAAVANVVERDGRGATLIAYVVSDLPAATPLDDLRGFVRQRLPDYMVPAFVVRLPALPLTSNGKIDRAALPVPEPAAVDIDAFVEPGNEVEEAVAAACRELLKIERISMRDNFFDLGGHSMLATQLASRLERELQLDVSLRSIFEAETLADLAGILLDRLLTAER